MGHYRFFIIAVWSITEHQKFEFFDDSDNVIRLEKSLLPHINSDEGAVFRALTLVIFCVFMAICGAEQ